MDIKTRKEADPRYTWNLADIFATKESWEKEYSDVQAEIPALAALSGKMMDSSDTLKEALDRIYDVAERVERVYLYAFLQKESDNSDPEYIDMAGKAEKLYIDLMSSISFINPEVLAAGKEKALEYVSRDDMAKYRHELDNIVRAEPHTLDSEKEKMMAMMSEVSGIPDNIFTMLESVDMSFPEMETEGADMPLSHGTYIAYMTDKNRAIRKEAYEKLFGEFRRYINTFAATYAGSVKFDTVFSTLRNFESALSSALFSSNVDPSVYDALIEAVHNGFPYMEKYTELRKKALGLDTLEMYDLYCPIVKTSGKKYTFEEACGIVLKAVSVLGDKYVATVKKAMTEHWIDVYENKGKTTGAFSCGVYGVHPYILLNFTGTLDDIYTLAHELGHTMHSYLSNENCDFCNHDYRILVAEVASTVNEVLLTYYLLDNIEDEDDKAYVLNHFLEGFRATVYRQTLFAEFEKEAHEIYAKGTPLSADVLNSVYHRLNTEYYSKVNICDLHDVEWARIPHFYRAFYVYQYATGFCSAVAIAGRIIETGKTDDYLRFLTLGGKDYPIEELKVAGVDLTDPDTINYALKIFDENIDKMAEYIH